MWRHSEVRLPAAIVASMQKYGLPENTDIDWVQWVPRLCADAGVTILP
jgi:hypothetical protein